MIDKHNHYKTNVINTRQYTIIDKHTKYMTNLRTSIINNDTQ